MKNLKTLLQRLSESLQNLNPRERTLAIIVLLLVLISVSVMMTRKAQAHLTNLEKMVDRKQQEIINYSLQIAKRKMVESQYVEIAGQHSSQWTASEIHDRLRQEIYRLAKKVPPELNINGTAEPTSNKRGDLVNIPKIGKGELHEGGEGYQEYSLKFRIPSGKFLDVLTFLERLQGSPQALRIDELEIKRPPSGTMVSTTIDITRIIAHGSIIDL